MLKIVLLLFVAALAVYAIPGGFEDASIDDEEVVAAANHATKSLSNTFSGNYHHKLVKILRAQQQVVAGMNYKLDIILGKTDCKKDEVEFENVDDCEFQEGISTYKKCQVLVYKDLSGNRKLVSTGCILASKKDL
ncbi:cystatin domain-containing protein [Caerostris darwini]|uniref:Cystatin domain-containing protein n=1 Tax=Caerostris darwini TaxID=1538125 RepID=A0AAV4WRI7_9ARAC|nr:cystatin domain-containing protein [Caerostris darwini]